MSRLTAHTLHANISDLVREETLDNEQYMVVPCILINEGVWNGVMYPASELSKHVEAWNGRPLVLGHPTVNGKPVTANSKKVKETKEIGLVLNTAWDPTMKALKAEAWINKAKCKIRAPKVLEKLENEEQIDVSTGLFTDDDMRANEFNGKSYECVALNHRPDHLAILPDSKGACSWNDGAGLCRINEAADGEELDVNEEKESEVAELTNVCDDCGTELLDGECPKCSKEEATPPKTNSIIASLLSFFGFKSEEALNKIPDMKLNEASLQDRMRFVEKALQNKINPAAAGWGPYAQPMTPMPWILEVYENWLVYNLNDKKYSVDYKFDKKAETVEFTSEPEEVVEKRVYTAMPKTNGGVGSGNFGHSGREGERGGSGGGDGSKSETARSEKSLPLGENNRRFFKEHREFSQGISYFENQATDEDRKGTAIDYLKKTPGFDSVLKSEAKVKEFQKGWDQAKAKAEGDAGAERLRTPKQIEDEAKAYAEEKTKGEFNPHLYSKGYAATAKAEFYQRAQEEYLKKNEISDPSGSEQPPVWANQEGSPNMDKQMKVNELITNGALDASLRETMMAAPEAVVTAFGLLADKASAPKTLAEMIEKLSPEEAKKAKDALALAKAKQEEEAAAKAELAKNIKGNSACKLTAEQVDGLDLAMLKNLSAMLPVAGPANHAAAAGGAAPKANENDDTPPEMLSIEEVLKANASK